jgi:hypothetical protein
MRVLRKRVASPPFLIWMAAVKVKTAPMFDKTAPLFDKTASVFDKTASVFDKTAPLFAVFMTQRE